MQPVNNFLAALNKFNANISPANFLALKEISVEERVAALKNKAIGFEVLDALTLAQQQLNVFASGDPIYAAIAKEEAAKIDQAMQKAFSSVVVKPVVQPVVKPVAQPITNQVFPANPHSPFKQFFCKTIDGKKYFCVSFEKGNQAARKALMAGGNIKVGENKGVMKGGYYDTKDAGRKAELLQIALNHGAINASQLQELKKALEV